jgi:glycosyltransferase involved in cell wall biosynthesis
MRSFCIVAPEYPPTRGGVADYTDQIARSLARRGHRVEVWAPGLELDGGQRELEPNLTLYALPDRFGAGSIKVLTRAFRADQSRATLLLQYVPQGFGLRGLNLPFLLWLTRYSGAFWVMFHEVVYPFERGQSLARHALAAGTRVMLSTVARRADRSFVSITRWTPYIERWGRTGNGATWAPVPSNLPTSPTRAPGEVRRTLGIPDDQRVLAYFGMYSEAIVAPLEAALDGLLGGHPERTLLLLGRNSREFAHKIGGGGRRIIATGELDAATAADSLAASDLALFPFSDGVSGRRTSLMAAIALGVPVATTEGALSEPLWRESRAVFLSPAGDAGAFVANVRQALADPVERARRGAAGRALYEAQFSLDRAVLRLVSDT